ncbi:MAG: hypothetical protein ACI9VR_002087 [Cognaticolwellia sp.]|jgi:hypothetical protein
MAVLRDLQSGRVITIHAEHLVGRSRRCDLRLEAPAISSQHATVRWTGSSWVVRDLGSRNGTLLDGGLLPTGEHPLAAGMTLHFGTESCGWVMDSDAPPVPNATQVHDETCSVNGVEGLLAIPNGESPSVNVYRNHDGSWIAEWVDGTEVNVGDLEIVLIDGDQWRLHLPEYDQATEQADSESPTLNTVRFVFDVSRDQEAIRLSIEFGTERWDLGERVHHWMLFLLAKALQDDDDQDASERGWVYCENLVRDVGMTEGTMSVYIFRARQQVAACGIEGAQSLVARRKPTKQVRFGADNILIRQH